MSGVEREITRREFLKEVIELGSAVAGEALLPQPLLSLSFTLDPETAGQPKETAGFQEGGYWDNEGLCFGQEFPFQPFDEAFLQELEEGSTQELNTSPLTPLQKDSSVNPLACFRLFVEEIRRSGHVQLETLQGKETILATVKIPFAIALHLPQGSYSRELGQQVFVRKEQAITNFARAVNDIELSTVFQRIILGGESQDDIQALLPLAQKAEIFAGSLRSHLYYLPLSALEKIVVAHYQKAGSLDGLISNGFIKDMPPVLKRVLSYNLLQQELPLETKGKLLEAIAQKNVPLSQLRKEKDYLHPALVFSTLPFKSRQKVVAPLEPETIKSWLDRLIRPQLPPITGSQADYEIGRQNQYYYDERQLVRVLSLATKPEKLAEAIALLDLGENNFRGHRQRLIFTLLDELGLREKKEGIIATAFAWLKGLLKAKSHTLAQLLQDQPEKPVEPKDLRDDEEDRLAKGYLNLVSAEIVRRERDPQDLFAIEQLEQYLSQVRNKAEKHPALQATQEQLLRSLTAPVLASVFDRFNRHELQTKGEVTPDSPVNTIISLMNPENPAELKNFFGLFDITAFYSRPIFEATITFLKSLIEKGSVKEAVNYWRYLYPNTAIALLVDGLENKLASQIIAQLPQELKTPDSLREILGLTVLYFSSRFSQPLRDLFTQIINRGGEDFLLSALIGFLADLPDPEAQLEKMVGRNSIGEIPRFVQEHLFSRLMQGSLTLGPWLTEQEVAVSPINSPENKIPLQKLLADRPLEKAEVLSLTKDGVIVRLYLGEKATVQKRNPLQTVWGNINSSVDSFRGYPPEKIESVRQAVEAAQDTCLLDLKLPQLLKAVDLTADREIVESDEEVTLLFKPPNLGALALYNAIRREDYCSLASKSDKWIVRKYNLETNKLTIQKVPIRFGPGAGEPTPPMEIEAPQAMLTGEFFDPEAFATELAAFFLLTVAFKGGMFGRLKTLLSKTVRKTPKLAELGISVTVRGGRIGFRIGQRGISAIRSRIFQTAPRAAAREAEEELVEEALRIITERELAQRFAQPTTGGIAQELASLMGRAGEKAWTFSEEVIEKVAEILLNRAKIIPGVGQRPLPPETHAV